VREIRLHGSEGGGPEPNRASLPLSSRWTQHLVAVHPTPHGVGLVRHLHKPIGRKAAGPRTQGFVFKPTDRVWNAVACIGHAAWRHAVGG